MEEELMWAEKYRPKRLDDIIDQDDVIRALKSFAKEKNVPHMLFAGPAGVGKTATAIAFARELYGENWRENTLELNASDERGIDTVRETIKERFARTLPVGDVPFKLIILDESDAMTADAQTALRRVMEIFARNVRFILTCNYSNKIIEPIQSRTVVFRFNPLPKDKAIERLKFIAKNEGVNVSEDGYEAIWDVSAGDMRKAINTLQSAAALSNIVNSDIVYKVVGMTRPKEVRELLNLALQGKFSDARDKLYELMYNYGLSGNDIVSQIHKEIFRLNTDESIKIKILKTLGDYEYRLMEGANEEIQLSSLLAQIVLIGYESKTPQRER